MTTVLFACVHNAGLSQMAAAFFNRHAAAYKASAVSAGPWPGAHLDPEVLATMAEVGIDLSEARPQLLTDELVRGAHLLITLGRGDACPSVPGLEREVWPFEDPQGKDVEQVRCIRDEVAVWVKRLIQRENLSAANHGWGDGWCPFDEALFPKVSELSWVLAYDSARFITLIGWGLSAVARYAFEAANEEACALVQRALELHEPLKLNVTNRMRFVLEVLGFQSERTQNVRESLDGMLRLTRAEWERSARLEWKELSPLPRMALPGSWLDRVFCGLILNAVAAMRAGAPRGHVLGVRSGSDPEWVWVTISATGPGLPPEWLPHLFEPLCPSPVPGSGFWLGLYSLRAIVERLGGTLRVENQPGLGVHFHVRFPTDAWARQSPLQPAHDERQLRALEDNERNTLRAVVACVALEISSSQRAVRSLAKRLLGMLKGPGMSPVLIFCFQHVLTLSRQWREHIQDLHHLGHTPLPPRSLSVEGCLVEALRVLGPRLARRAQVERDFAPGLPPVLGHERHLRQVFLLLLRICLRSPRPGTPRPLWVRAWREEEWVCTSLSHPNDGISNPNGDDYRLFMRVMTCQLLVEAMGGELRVDHHEEGARTTWSVRLPVNDGARWSPAGVRGRCLRGRCQTNRLTPFLGHLSWRQVR